MRAALTPWTMKLSSRVRECSFIPSLGPRLSPETEATSFPLLVVGCLSENFCIAITIHVGCWNMMYTVMCYEYHSEGPPEMLAAESSFSISSLAVILLDMFYW